jgi:hypothetical protein
MTPPRWFYPLVAVCLVVLTAAGVWSATGNRYVPATDDMVLDTRTGKLCMISLENELVACFPIDTPGKLRTDIGP